MLPDCRAQLELALSQSRETPKLIPQVATTGTTNALCSAERASTDSALVPARFSTPLDPGENDGTSILHGVEPLVGAMLPTLAASKPGGCFLELGWERDTTSWLLEGMDARSTLISVDNDSTVQQGCHEPLHCTTLRERFTSPVSLCR